MRLDFNECVLIKDNEYTLELYIYIGEWNNLENRKAPTETAEQELRSMGGRFEYGSKEYPYVSMSYN